MPTISSNIFTNEWNGELISLMARLALGSDQSLNLAGLEIWGWGVVTVFGLARVTGLTRATAAWLSLVVLSMPICLGLAMVIKGDLLAAIGLFLAVACLSSGLSEGKPWSFAFALLCLSFAAGSKIVVVPAAGLLGLVIIYKLLVECPAASVRLIWTLPFLLIGVARYLLNWWFYSAPFKRVAAEHSVWGWHTFVGNLQGLTGKIFDKATWLDSAGPHWVFAFGTGYAGILGVLSFVFCLFAIGRRNPFRALVRWLPYLVPLSLGWLFVLLSVKWEGWSFRYHLPWVALLIFGSVALGARRLNRTGRFILAGTLAFVVFMQYDRAFEIGEVNAQPYVNVLRMSDVERKLAFHPYFWTPALKALANGPSQKILVFSDLDAMLLPLMGENNRHQLVLVEDSNQLVRSMADRSFDYVAVAGRRLTETASIAALFDSKQFQLVQKTPEFAIYRRDRSLDKNSRF
jgi:hypothetical protein